MSFEYLQLHSIAKTERFLFVLLFCISSINLHSQEFTQFHYPNGQVSSEGIMENGKPNGYWKTFYENGTIKSQGKRTNFQLDSIWCFYNELGQIEKEISYFEDKKNGYYKEYATRDSVSYLQMSVLYVNNQKQGIEKHFSHNNFLTKEIPYQDNKKEGKGFEYTDSIVTAILIYENDNLISSQAINRTDKNGEKTGLHISFYPNGAMKTEANYSNGKLNGLYKMFNPHEQLIQVGNYEQDSLVYSSSALAEFEDPFVKKEYYSDSTLKYKGAFREKTPIGTHRTYDKKGAITGGALYDINGNLLGTGVTLENGDKNGDWIFFYSDGKKESEGAFLNGLQTGLWKFYYPDGTIKQKGEFRNGKFNGTWLFYNEVGDLQKEEEYVSGRREGLSIEYDDEEEKVLEGMYKDDLRQGFWTIRIGDLISQGEYKYGEKIGLWKSSYLNGNKAFKGNFSGGKESGTHIYYYQNGRIEHNEQWKNGKPIKSWNYYSENGNLKFTIYYKNGVESQVVSPSK